MTGRSCPACGCQDVSHAAGPIRAGRWWYRCRDCGLDRFGPAPAPVDPGARIGSCRTCPECARRFDMTNAADVSEWFAGHDCEPVRRFDPCPPAPPACRPVDYAWPIPARPRAR